MAELHKYGTSGKFYVPLLLASTQNFASTSIITFASSDVTIVKDGSTYRNLSNTPTGVAMGSAAVFEIVTSASEMGAKKIAIQIKDETGALVQDQMLIIDTYGASSAAHEFDLDQAIENSTIAAVVFVSSDVRGKVVGAVASVTADVTVSSTYADDITDKVWDETVALHATTSQFGGLIGITLDDIITSRLATTEEVQLSSCAISQIWNEAVLGHASSSQFGGMFTLLLDDSITSRMSSTKSVLGSTETARANVIQVVGGTSAADALTALTTGRIDNLDNLDELISSRLGTTVGAQLATTAIDSIWDEPTVGHASSSQFGGFILNRMDDQITSRMSSTKSVLGSTAVALADLKKIGGSTVTFDNLEDDYDGTGYTKVNSVIGTASALTANNDKTGYALATTAQNDIVDKVWDEPLLAHSGTSQMGGLIVTQLDGTITSRLGTTVGVQFGTTAQNYITDEINDALFTDATSESTGLAGSIANKVSLTYERFYHHVQQDASSQVVMKLGSTVNVKAVMTVTETTALQTKQQATTV